MAHYLITRFNVDFGQSIYSKDKNNNETRDETWLKKRFFLFDNFCYPSVKNQTTQNFKWFVYFDKKTPIEYKKKIDDYKKQMGNFIPIFVKDGEDFFKKNLELIRKTTKDDIIIITRLDNDDAILNNYLETIQKYVDEKKIINGFLDFIYGYQYDFLKKVLTKIKIQSNHFISKIEHISCLSNEIYSIHSHINNHPNNQHINNIKNPLWIEIVHENNVLNFIRTNNTKVIFFSNLPYKISYWNSSIRMIYICSINIKNKLRHILVILHLKDLVKKLLKYK